MQYMYKCDQVDCGRTFETVMGLAHHRRMVHGIMERFTPAVKSERSETCPVCNGKFTKQGMRKHLGDMHNIHEWKNLRLLPGVGDLTEQLLIKNGWDDIYKVAAVPPVEIMTKLGISDKFAIDMVEGAKLYQSMHPQRTKHHKTPHEKTLQRRNYRQRQRSIVERFMVEKPMDERPLKCDVPGCPYWAKNARVLGSHKWGAHRIRGANRKVEETKPLPTTDAMAGLNAEQRRDAIIKGFVDTKPVVADQGGFVMDELKLFTKYCAVDNLIIESNVDLFACPKCQHKLDGNVPTIKHMKVIVSEC